MAGGARHLLFDASEYEARLARARIRMAEAGLDTLLVHTPENIAYMSGFQTPGYYMYGCLVVPCEGSLFLVIRKGEFGNALSYSWVEDFASYVDVEDPIAVTIGAMCDRGLVRGTIGLELDAWFLTTRNYLKLAERLKGARIVDASGTVEKCRLVKSQAEVECIRKACRSAEAGMRAAVDAIEVGVTDNHVAAELSRAMIEAGSEYAALGPFVAAGYKSSIMHGIWGGGKRIEAGESIILEIAGTVGRYNGAVMRPVSVGEPSDQLKRMAEASERANMAAIQAIGPGVTAESVHLACNAVFEEYGLMDLRRGTRSGYSIGIAFAPDWGEGHILSLRDGERTLLEPGMVFHLPSAVRSYPSYGASFSETTLVTESGHEVLTNFDRELFVRRS